MRMNVPKLLFAEEVPGRIAVNYQIEGLEFRDILQVDVLEVCVDGAREGGFDTGVVEGGFGESVVPGVEVEVNGRSRGNMG